MLSPTCLNISANSPVGIESSVEDINALLSIGMHDKRMVEIFGVGGIGKTAITEVIYESISHQFEDKCFIQKVRRKLQSERMVYSIGKRNFFLRSYVTQI
jgi:replication-associated recombination protein RarA